MSIEKMVSIPESFYDRLIEMSTSNIEKVSTYVFMDDSGYYVTRDSFNNGAFIALSNNIKQALQWFIEPSEAEEIVSSINHRRGLDRTLVEFFPIRHIRLNRFLMENPKIKLVRVTTTTITEVER